MHMNHEDTVASPTLFLFAADLGLGLHWFFVLFVIAGLVLIVAGGFRGWQWGRERTFRYAHLAAIAVVVLQSWLGMICPLPTLEMWLRRQGGDAPYAGTFISYWMQVLLYYQAPAWVFAAVYTAFGLCVVATWYWVPLDKRR